MNPSSLKKTVKYKEKVDQTIALYISIKITNFQ